MGRWVTSPAHQAMRSVLVEARQAAGLTQRDVADRLGKANAPSYVAKIEKGERQIDLVEFVALARALDRDERELFSAVVERMSTTT